MASFHAGQLKAVPHCAEGLVGQHLHDLDLEVLFEVWEVCDVFNLADMGDETMRWHHVIAVFTVHGTSLSPAPAG